MADRFVKRYNPDDEAWEMVDNVTGGVKQAETEAKVDRMIQHIKDYYAAKEQEEKQE